jgi:NAD(P)H-hydrate epimerase
MKAFDRQAIERLGVSGLILMENAGRGCVDLIERRRLVAHGGSVAVVAGKGNNGGDGFVMARHLALRGYAVTVWMTDADSEISPEARSNFEICRSAGMNLHLIGSVPEHEFAAGLRSAHLIVDALLGTGFSGSPGGIVATAITCMNGSGIPVFSVDVPSGLDATTGRVSGIAVKASATGTMGLLKQGLLLGDGPGICGCVDVVDIGVPLEGQGDGPDRVRLIEAADVSGRLPVRARSAHKYSAGKVLVIAGSRGFTGAPVLSAMAALRSGAGAVVLASASSVIDSLAGTVEEPILLRLPETQDGTIGSTAVSALSERLNWADAVVIGPGLGRNEETGEVVRRVVSRSERPIVLDADGLGAFKGKAELLREKTSPAIITPHSGELGRLLSRETSDIESNRVEIATRTAAETQCTVVFKGAPTVIGARTGGAFINTTGNQALATVGTGDVLAGILGALLAVGLSADDAAACGVFVHGRCADTLALTTGHSGMIAGDIVREMPRVLHDLRGGRD